MPNWAYNTLTIKSTKERLIEIREAMKGDHRMPNKEFELDFYKIKEDGDFGVKWNACEIEQTDNLNNENTSNYELEYVFHTAWLWPQPVIEAFCEKYPDVEIDYTCTAESFDFAIHGWNENGTFNYHEIERDDMFTDDNILCYIDQYFEERQDLNRDEYDIDSIFDELKNISWEVEFYGFDYNIETIDAEIIHFNNDFADLCIRPYDIEEFEEIIERTKH